MQQNAEDGGNRKFIMVQLPEETPADSEARKAGYENIAQLGRERIRRAAAKIREDLADKIAERPEDKPLDTGFRAFKVADTAFLDVERHPAELEQGQLLELADNIKTDRTPADLLTQVMLELGLTLDLPIETKQVGDNTVFYVAHNALVACFDEDVPLTLIDEMVKVQPLQVAFKDAGFGSDDALINAETHLKRLSPDTILSVI
jgi:adenine-specific DNA-methyltransferase